MLFGVAMISLKRRIFNYAAGLILRLMRLNSASRVSCYFAYIFTPKFSTKCAGITLVWDCPNELTLWRAQTLFTKEPETIEWINGFSEGDIMFDVGANVGLYSIYAGSRGIRVHAFEPEAQNFALLNRNIVLNNLTNSVTAYPVGIADVESFQILNIPEVMTGGALNSVGTELDWNLKPFIPRHKQGIYCTTIDSFVARTKDLSPNHIKIDVDGLESQIIAGATGTLRSSSLKSISIEINESLDRDIKTVRFLESMGFKFLHKKHASMFDASQFCHVYNYVFINSSGL